MNYVVFIIGIITMENFLFVLRIAGCVSFFAGVLLVMGIAWYLYRRDLKNRRDGQRILEQAQKEGLKEGTYEIENAQVVVEKNEQNESFVARVSFPVSDAWQENLSYISCHCMLIGALLFVGGMVGWFENKLLWLLVLLFCPIVPFVAVWLCVFIIKLGMFIVRLLDIFASFLQLLVVGILLLGVRLIFGLTSLIFKLKRA